MAGTSEESTQEWWRWPLMPFAAISGAFIGSILAAVFRWLGMKLQGGFSEDGWYFRYVMPVISSAIFGYLYAHISCRMAPRGKVIAGTVMVTIFGIFCLCSAVLAWVMPNYPIGQSIQVTVGIIATMIDAVVTLVDAKG